MTRIYRLVLDETRTQVRKIAATGVSIPKSVPLGSQFDFSAETPFNEQNKELTVQFESIGFQYNDPILIKEFNENSIVTGKQKINK